MTKFIVLLLPLLGVAATIPADLSGVRPGAASVSATAGALSIRNASPQYWAATGKRRGPAGFDEFFDYPGHHPGATQRFE